MFLSKGNITERLKIKLSIWWMPEDNLCQSYLSICKIPPVSVEARKDKWRTSNGKNKKQTNRSDSSDKVERPVRPPSGSKTDNFSRKCWNIFKMSRARVTQPLLSGLYWAGGAQDTADIRVTGCGSVAGQVPPPPSLPSTTTTPVSVRGLTLLQFSVAPPQMRTTTRQ